MPDFTQRVQTAAGCFDIGFKENRDVESREYFITVVEDDYAAPPFSMKLTDGRWTISDTEPVSLWLKQLESSLQSALTERAAV